MMKRHENKISMYDGVHAYINGHESNAGSGSGVMLINAELGNKISEIRTKENLRKYVLIGKTDAKNSSRREIITLGLSFASKLFDYGKKSGNSELRSQSDFTRSELNQARDTELVIILHNISQNTETNLEALIPYGITQEKLSKFRQKTDSFQTSLESRLTSQAVKTSARKTLNTLFREADMIVKSLDKMMEEYIESDEQFYNGYKSVRFIRNLGIRYKLPTDQNLVQAPEHVPKPSE